jgi:hypothetical protein
MPELEMPERPKDEFPKSELPKPETPKREPPKSAIERPGENDENDENRDDAGRFVERRFERNPKLAECWFVAVLRLVPKGENPEIFRPNEAFREFPNERHWPSGRTLFP